METPHPPQSPSVTSGPLRESLADAIRFWEPCLVYNLALTAIAVVWLVATWPHFRMALTLSSLFLHYRPGTLDYWPMFATALLTWWTFQCSGQPFARSGATDAGDFG